MADTTARFDGWAVIELFGHQRAAGYVTTQYFGGACLFQADVPELPQRDYVLDEPQYVAGTWTAAGSTVRREESPARTRMLGPGAIYALTPCTEEAARIAIERLYVREIVVFSAGKPTALPPGDAPPLCDDCGNLLDECQCDGDE